MNDIMDNSGQTKRQFITFWLGEQEFGADIMAIREIRGWTATTELPHSPHYVLGVINLRGMVLPVVDLKARLGRGRTEATAKNVIIVVRCAEQTMGVLVDAVSDILTVTESDIQVTPELARDADSEFVEGIAVLDQRMVTILSMERLAETLVAQHKVSLAA
ncbi:MAG: chemotaxis protein CheW [Alphaproteobacteria bacterium]|nr:chemotaxis protein CheW [Alphaproteobacteria bacterium]MDE2011460.1 purine-binding chemotaxis protein CheW [Alphaproteobacteria bacterium]MDE2071851.1 purine-binding chemotaxis protein CheW [Alphaproteobacteria bacterium]